MKKIPPQFFTRRYSIITEIFQNQDVQNRNLTFVNLAIILKDTEVTFVNIHPLTKTLLILYPGLESP